MKLPFAESAEIDIRKLREYCLNPLHPEGKHKARLFASALGMTEADAESLRAILLSACIHTDVEPGRVDGYGRRYTMDVVVEWKGKSAVIRCGWIVESGTQTPRLTTSFPR